MSTPQLSLIREICNQAVEDLFIERQTPKKETITLFTISGKSKDTQKIAYYISKFTSGMTFAEGLAAITTFPLLMENIQKEFPQVKLEFNSEGIKNTVNEGR
jgi:hypothetical protein